MIVFRDTRNNTQSSEFTYFGFTCTSRMNYFSVVKGSLYNKDNCVDEVVYGIFDRRGGCRCEFGMRWYSISGKDSPRLEVFADNFNEISKAWHMALMREIVSLGKNDFSPEDFSRVLIRLGFEDLSDIKLT